jgi:hypothetical protein
MENDLDHTQVDTIVGAFYIQESVEWLANQLKV